MITSGPKGLSKQSAVAKDQWLGRPTVRFFKPRMKSDPIRQDLVDHVKAQIAAGTYDTPERFDAAFDRMLQRFGLD